MGPGDPILGVPSTTIPKRPSLPPDDKGTRFERRPEDKSGTASKPDVTDNSEAGLQTAQSEKRLFRQSVSASFHTTVLTAQNARAPARNRAAQSLSLTTRTQDELASRE
jgi:hypothetical protein